LKSASGMGNRLKPCYGLHDLACLSRLSLSDAEFIRRSWFDDQPYWSRFRRLARRLKPTSATGNRLKPCLIRETPNAITCLSRLALSDANLFGGYRFRTTILKWEFAKCIVNSLWLSHCFNTILPLGSQMLNHVWAFILICVSF